MQNQPRSNAPAEKRNREVLADVVRAYIETGTPVSSRRISRRHAEALSPATIRNVMADLEEEGFLHQPHTSAGRVPTPSAYRFYAQQLAGQATLGRADSEWIRRELDAARTPEELMERASHVLAAISHGLGIVVAPPLSKVVLEHIRFLLLPDGRVLAVLISCGGLARDKMIQLERILAQDELDRTADYLNRHYPGWTLDAIRADLLAHLDRERERYDCLVSNALLLCDPKVLGGDSVQQVYVEGAAQIAAAPEFARAAQLTDLLSAIEEKRTLVTLLTGCIEAPEPLYIQIGVEEISSAGAHLALIGAAYGVDDRIQGSLGVLGPLRMQYERAITAVAYVAQHFSQNLGRS